MPIREQERLRSFVGRITRSSGGRERVAEQPVAAAAALSFITKDTEALPVPEPGETGHKVQVTGELAAATQSAAEKLAHGDRDMTPLEMLATEAIIIPDKRPAFDIVDGNFSIKHEIWGFLADDPQVHARLVAAIPSIGRVELPGQRRILYGGTGLSSEAGC